MSEPASRRYWEGVTARLALGVNTAVWLERFAPALFGVCTGGAVAFYALRRVQEPAAWGWMALAAGVVIAAAASLWRARRGFFSPADARVLLESGLRLDAALTAATDGATGWPAPPASRPAVVRWRSPAVTGWVTASVAMLAASLWLPVPADSRPNAAPVEKPPSLAQTEAMLRELAQLQVASPESLEQLTAEARELGDRPTEQQYTHSGLEAADALRDQTMNAVNQLADGLDSAASALAALEAGAGGLSDELVKSAADQMGAALQGLRDGRLRPSSELMSLLNATGAAHLRGLSPQQLSQMRSQLNAASGRARGITGAAGRDARIAGRDGQGRMAGGRAGAGGIQRGRGDAPLSFNLVAANRQDGVMQAVGSEDLSRATLGDLVEVTRDRHEVDRSKFGGPVEAGAAAAPARGGEAVWVNRLTPAERAVLRDFFK